MRHEKFEILHENEPYNIASFLQNHPGGINYLQPYSTKEVAQRMQETAHSEAAYYLLKEYKLKGRNFKDAEDLVDWSKPMLSQVANLGSKYKDWVIMPVDRKLQLFGNPFLESLTITPWYVVPVLWLPVIAFFVVSGGYKYKELSGDSQVVQASMVNVLLGVFLWTLLEYSLHRWVFHIEPSGRSKLMIYVHFAIHGLHHKVPFDSRRLVFPPVPAAAIVYVLYQIFSFIIPESRIIQVISGGLLGYVVYDMIHFYLHHGTPKESSYFYHLKRYHNQHHFAHHNSGFGISSTFWDKVFGTGIVLRKLAMTIKW